MGMPVVALLPYALVSFNLGKAYLKIPDAYTDDDDLIRFSINSATDFLESETQRFLGPRTGIVEYQDGRGQNVILLKQWPVNALTEIRIDNSSLFLADTVQPLADYALVDDNMALLRINSTFHRGYRNIKITYSAGYATVPSDLQEAALWTMFWKFKTRNAGDIGRTTQTKEGESTSYSQEAPADVKNAIARYKRTEFYVPNAGTYNG